MGRPISRVTEQRRPGVPYHREAGTDQFGVFGTPDQVREQLEALAATGATHILLNPVTRFAEQLDALAEIVGLPET